MARLMRMPEVAANTTEAVLAEWLVTENTRFEAQDVIATVETDKAVVDVEAETDGVIIKTLVPSGAQVEVGAPIAVIAEPGEQVQDLAALLAELGIAEGAPSVVPEADAPKRRNSEAVAPSARASGYGVERAPRADPQSKTAPAEHPDNPPDQTVSSRMAGSTSDAARARVFASPLARRMAREAGLDVEDINGTGPGNRILRRDVERVLAAGHAGAATPFATATSAGHHWAGATARTTPAAAGGFSEVPHSRVRRATAARLAESKQTVPHFYVRATLRVDRLLSLRAELNDGLETPVSLNDLVIKAAAASHRQVPEMNVVWTPDAVRRYDRVDLAIAVATDRGLVTPVVRDAASLSVTELAATVRDLVGRARAGRLKQEELEGGTMSVSNLGMYGTEEFAAIINPPQASILAVGGVREEPVIDNGTLAAGMVMRVTLSVDHRPVDGVVAAQWMQAFRDLVEHPARILA